MRDTIIFHVLVYLFVQVEAIDPDAHVSFALVFPKETNRRLRRYVELSPSAYTEEEKKAMLDAHNEYRRITNPSAADMNLLTWNDQLADSVQTWTEECIWDHGQVEFENQQYDPMGQNLWRGGNKVSVSAVRAWMNEDKYYNYTEHVCQPGKVCGHYTQVLWDTTKQMGCGYHSCENGKTIVGCNYGPAGNYNRRPYIEGPRCSQCSEPGFCYNGLCSQQCYDESVVNGTCECSFECQHCGVLNETECTCACKPGWNGAQCEKTCEDTSKHCNNGWYKPQCERYSYVKNGCPAMCGVCELLTDENSYECPCDGKICKNGGQLDTGSCICECQDGFSGDVCEYVVTSVCDGKTCQNGGYLTVETCTCACSDGYTGTVCENIVTTQASTTQASSTQASSTQASTTKAPSTQASTTSESTTKASTNASTRATTSSSIRASTQASTTQASITQVSTTQPSTTQPSTTQPSTNKPSTTQPSTNHVSTTQPSTTQTSTNKPSTTQSSTNKPSTTHTPTTKPSTTQSLIQMSTQASTTNVSTNQRSITQPSTNKPSTSQPSITNAPTTTSSTTQPLTTQPSTTQPSTTQPSTTQPSIQMSTQESTQATTQVSTQPSNQTSAQVSTQTPNQASTQASTQTSTQVSTQAPTHASTQASTNQDLTQASSKGSTQASIRASTQASTIPSAQASTIASAQASTEWSTHPPVTVSTDIDSKETITATEQQNTINMTTTPTICQLTCSKNFVGDISTCKCIKKDELPVGSANICTSSPVCVIIITTILFLLSHEYP